MGKEKNSFVKLCSYFALVLAALLICINVILPKIGVKITGDLVNVMVLVKDVALLFGICFGAYSFTKNKGVGWHVVYWVSIVLYLGCAVFGVIK